MAGPGCKNNATNSLFPHPPLVLEPLEKGLIFLFILLFIWVPYLEVIQGHTPGSGLTPGDTWGTLCMQCWEWNLSCFRQDNNMLLSSRSLWGVFSEPLLGLGLSWKTLDLQGCCTLTPRLTSGSP